MTERPSRLNDRRTPCVGICSTTYGDLVCRGCKRFAHEIVQWNGFALEQREAVWARLHAVRAGAFDRWLAVVDRERLRAAAGTLGLTLPELAADSHWAELAYEVLRRLAPRRPALDALGLAAASDADFPDAGAALDAVDRECYQRSVALYERSFHTLAQ